MPSLLTKHEHPLSDFYYCRARYKVAWGGRASAKSTTVAEALVRLASLLPLRILCTREYQNSIRDSSHRILKDMIAHLGMESWFEVTQDSIRSFSGAEFIFKGLHGNEQGIKSTQGINICWVEEAQTVTDISWRTLLPTVRGGNNDAEIWVTYNLLDEADATHSMFVTKGRKGSIVHKVNYDTNPFFDNVMRAEMEQDKSDDQHLYEHIWLGMPLKVSDAVILSGKYRVEEFSDDLWRVADRLHYGADFGFSQDPSTLIRSFIIGRTLYIEYEAWELGVELDDYAQFYDTVPGSRDWPIKCDNSQPALISHLRRLGFNASGAEKWDGSIKDGITYLRGFQQIIIHPRCVQTAKEARMYRYKVDPRVVDDKGQPQVLPIVVDKHNHCIDAVRYSYDGLITRGGELGAWARLGQ